MVRRLREVLVSSFIGAIGLGFVFSQGILHVAYVFSAPVAGWLSRREYERFAGKPMMGFSVRDALPELVRSVSLLLIGYLLLRWLYYKPAEPETQSAGPEPSTQLGDGAELS